MKLRFHLGPRSLTRGVLEKGSPAPLGGISEKVMCERWRYKGNALCKVLLILPPEKDVPDWEDPLLDPSAVLSGTEWV